jgi:uncharacterized coiled-coil protein SlyX
MQKSQYLTIAPVTPKGKWTVCSRRVGSRERFSLLAETRNEGDADKLVDALDALQGKIDTISVPLERDLVIARRCITELTAAVAKAREEASADRNKLRHVERKADDLESRNRSLTIALEVAQKTARENA